LASSNLALFALAALITHFLSPENGSVFGQSVELGLVQIAVSFSVNLVLILSAARLAAWFARKSLWLAVRLALDPRRN
jgi:threonine/homoserine/homoserine lactone efflux protein